MSDEQVQIEALLRALPLRRPTASLDARVLGGRPARLAALRLVFACGVAAAAAAAVLILMLWPANPARPPAPAVGTHALAAASTSAPAGAAPFRVEETWSNVSYEGTVALDDQTPVRQFIQNRVERTRWVDPQTGKVFQITVPVKELILVKAETY